MVREGVTHTPPPVVHHCVFLCATCGANDANYYHESVAHGDDNGHDDIECSDVDCGVVASDH